MPPDQRLVLSLRMTNRLVLECKSAIREHPNWNEQEVGLAFIRVNDGEERLLSREGLPIRALECARVNHVAETVGSSACPLLGI
jgi:hypothetical protein